MPRHLSTHPVSADLGDPQGNRPPYKLSHSILPGGPLPRPSLEQAVIGSVPRKGQEDGRD